MNTHFNEWPPDFAAFTAARRRQVDAMTADAVIREVSSNVAISIPEQSMSKPSPVVIEGELTVLVAERRLVLSYFAPGQTDLADLVVAELGFRDHAFGVGHVGRVRITVDPLELNADETEQER